MFCACMIHAVLDLLVRLSEILELDHGSRNNLQAEFQVQVSQCGGSVETVNLFVDEKGT